VINLRYHIVSIVAVFLALAVGVVMGSTVIARSELDLLHNRQNDLEDRNKRVSRDNAALKQENEALRKFQEEAETPLLAGDLAGVPVVLVGIRGIEQGPADTLREQLANAGAQSQGTIWLTRKLRLDNEADIRSLATALGIPAGSAADTRVQALGVLAEAIGGTATDASPLAALRDAGFVEIEPSAASVVTTTIAGAGLPSTPASGSGTRVVVMSGAGAEVSDDEVAIPLVRAFAGIRPGVVAVEAGTDEPGGREVFVGPLRRDRQLTPGVSTVDDLEAFAGRAAVVVLLRQPATAPAGHYGVGPQAERELPPPVPES
jgi:copper transport outer membrane protein MctB